MAFNRGLPAPKTIQNQELSPLRVCLLPTYTPSFDGEKRAHPPTPTPEHSCILTRKQDSEACLMAFRGHLEKGEMKGGIRDPHRCSVKGQLRVGTILDTLLSLSGVSSHPADHQGPCQFCCPLPWWLLPPSSGRAKDSLITPRRVAKAAPSCLPSNI